MSLPTTPARAVDPVTRKAAAVDLLTHHGDVTRRQIRTREALIDAARDAGLSWRAIGEALGEHHETVRVRHLSRQGQ